MRGTVFSANTEHTHISKRKKKKKNQALGWRNSCYNSTECLTFSIRPTHPRHRILFPLADQAANILSAKSKEHPDESVPKTDGHVA